ncbi:MAG: hypothetical protein WBV93_00430 [Anaerobacillus sp.]
MENHTLEKKLEEYLEELKTKKKEIENQIAKEEVEQKFLINKLDIVADASERVNSSLRENFCQEYLEPLQTEVDEKNLACRDNKTKYRAEIHQYEMLIAATEQKLFSLK